MQQEVTSKIKQSLEKKMHQLQKRLGALEDSTVFEMQIIELETEIIDLETVLTVGSNLSPGHRSTLEAQLEYLLTERKHLLLRLDLLNDSRSRLQETLDELQLTFSQQQLDMLPDPRKGWSVDMLHNQRALGEERQKILGLLHEKRLTVEVAHERLTVLDVQEEKVQAKQRPRRVRIRVINIDTNHTHVNLTLPIGLLKAGLRAGGTVAGIEGINIIDLEAVLNRGVVGHFVNLYNASNSERLEILVE